MIVASEVLELPILGSGDVVSVWGLLMEGIFSIWLVGALCLVAGWGAILLLYALSPKTPSQERTSDISGDGEER